ALSYWTLGKAPALRGKGGDSAMVLVRMLGNHLPPQLGPRRPVVGAGVVEREPARELRPPP
ncbi:hypothetical protein P3L51_21630, partial [Streptomyces sp. PSRA5]|uniref:hypothetical protein n=1 Tax=Streptomyces panacea TaxID=3035064 RepID=UPI00339BD2E9